MITTERLHIVPLDYMDLVRYISQRHGGIIKTDADEKEIYEKVVVPMLQCDEKYHPYFTIWVVYFEDRIIAEVGFKGVVNEHGVIEIWIEVLSNERGKGFGTEIIEGMCKWVNETGSVGFVGASILPENEASKKIFLKNQFQYACNNQGFGIYFKTIETNILWHK